MGVPSCHTANSDPHSSDLGGASRARKCAACAFDSLPGARFCAGCGLPLRTPSFAAAAKLAFGSLTDRSASGELRLATVLFADIVDSTEQIAELDPEQAMHRLQPAITLMCEAVECFGGTVMRTLGDGVMALFGAPTQLEDHARLACSSALHMQAEFARAAWGLCIRVGLHSGLVACDPQPADGRQRGLAHGLTIHLANRIQALASPGSVAMTHDCHSLVTGLVDVESMGCQKLKGVPNAVEVFRLAGLRDAAAN